MNIDIRKISRDIGALDKLEFTLTPNDLKLEFEGFEFKHTVDFDGQITSLSKNRMNLKGQIKTKVLSRCDRCLDEFEIEIELDLDAIFISTYGLDSYEQNDLENEDYYYGGYNIVPDKAIVDAIILELPLKNLCKEDCKGICPVCKVNRNEKQCNCDLDNKEPSKFEELKKLL